MPLLQIYDFEKLEWKIQNIDVTFENNLESITFSTDDWKLNVKRNDKVYFRHIIDSTCNIYIFINSNINNNNNNDNDNDITNINQMDYNNKESIEIIELDNNNNNNNNECINNNNIIIQSNSIDNIEQVINPIKNTILVVNLRDNTLESILGDYENMVEIEYDEPISNSLLSIVETIDTKFNTLFFYNTPKYSLSIPQNSKFPISIRNLRSEDRKLKVMIEDFEDTLKLLEKECIFIRDQLNLFGSCNFSEYFEKEVNNFIIFLSSIKLSCDNISKEYLWNNAQCFIQFREFIRLFYWKNGNPEECISSPMMIRTNHSDLSSSDFEPLVLDNTSSLSSSSSSYFHESSVYMELVDQCRDIFGYAKKLLASIESNIDQASLESSIITYISFLDKSNPIITMASECNNFIQQQTICSPRSIPLNQLLEYIQGLKTVILSQDSMLNANIQTLKDSIQEFIKCILGILRCVMTSYPLAMNNPNSTCSSPAFLNSFTPRSASSYNLCHALSADSPRLITSLSSSRLNYTLRKRGNHISYAAFQLLPLVNETILSHTGTPSSEHSHCNSVEMNTNDESSSSMEILESLADLPKKTVDEDLLSCMEMPNPTADQIETAIQLAIGMFLASFPEKTPEEVDRSIWLERNDEICNVIYDDSPIRVGNSKPIKSATLNQLIIKLTNELSQELKFAKTFICTFRSFTKPEILLEKLIQRYYAPNFGIHALTYFKSKIQRPIQLRVLNVLKMWVAQRPADFSIEMIKTITLFLFNARATGHGQISDIILKQFNNVKLKKKLELPPVERLPTSKIFWKKYSTEFILSLNEMEVAKQMTLLDFDTFASIDEFELFDKAWTRPELQHRTPNVMIMIDRFNSISSFVSTSILNEVEQSKRVKLIVKMIKLSKCLLKLSNFNSLLACLAGMYSSSIYRLQKTRERIPTKYQRQLELLSKLIDTKYSHKAYRESIQNRCPPLIPYLGIHLTDLVFIEEGNPNFNKELINFKKRELVYQVITQIKQYQQQPYTITPKIPILQFLREFPRVPSDKRTHEDKLYQMSLRIEARVSLSSSESSMSLPPVK